MELSKKWNVENKQQSRCYSTHCQKAYKVAIFYIIIYFSNIIVPYRNKCWGQLEMWCDTQNVKTDSIYSRHSNFAMKILFIKIGISKESQRRNSTFNTIWTTTTTTIWFIVASFSSFLSSFSCTLECAMIHDNMRTFYEYKYVVQRNILRKRRKRANPIFCLPTFSPGKIG